MDKPKQKAASFTANIGKRVRDSLMGEDPTSTSIKDHRTAAISLCLWQGLARFEEIQVMVLPRDSLELFIASAKTYSMRNPHTGDIAPTGWEDCPVKFVLEYM